MREPDWMSVAHPWEMMESALSRSEEVQGVVVQRSVKTTRRLVWSCWVYCNSATRHHDALQCYAMHVHASNTDSSEWSAAGWRLTYTHLQCIHPVQARWIHLQKRAVSRIGNVTQYGTHGHMHL